MPRYITLSRRDKQSSAVQGEDSLRRGEESCGAVQMSGGEERRARDEGRGTRGEGRAADGRAGWVGRESTVDRLLTPARVGGAAHPDLDRGAMLTLDAYRELFVWGVGEEGESEVCT